MRTILKLLLGLVTWTSWAATMEPCPDEPALECIQSDYVPLLRSLHDEVESLVQSIIKKYPPSTHVYIGPGTGPGLLIEALKFRLGPEAAYNFPISKTRYHDWSTFGNLEWRMALEPALDFLPPREILSKKEVVIIDAIGDSLSFPRKIDVIELAFKLRDGKSPPLKGRAYYFNRRALDSPTNPKCPAEYIEAPPKLAEVWLHPFFEVWAEFSEWDPLSHYVVSRNPVYPTFHAVFTKQWAEIEHDCSWGFRVRSKLMSAFSSRR
jgi:hypothetical protein